MRRLLLRPWQRHPAGLHRVDGCSWVLESGGEVLEPINLESFLDDPEDGMRLEVEYDFAENMFSICMVGPMVVLTSCEPVR